MATLNVKNFPDELHRTLVQQAKKDHRSLTGEVIYLLQWAIQAPLEERYSILQMRGLGKKRWRDIDAAKHIDKERDSWE